MARLHSNLKETETKFRTWRPNSQKYSMDPRNRRISFALSSRIDRKRAEGAWGNSRTPWASAIQNRAFLTAKQYTSLHNAEHETPPYRIESHWLPYSTWTSTIQYTSLYNAVHEPLRYSTRASTIQYTSLYDTVHEPLRYSTRASYIQYTNLYNTERIV